MAATEAAEVLAAREEPLRLNYDCPRCGTRHEIACCCASRHNKCDQCVAQQWAARAERIRRARMLGVPS